MILTTAWSGDPVHHHGEHYTVDGVQFLPPPGPATRVSVWVAGFPGNVKPLRRAARTTAVAERPGRFCAPGNFGQYLYVASDTGTVLVRNGRDWGVDNDTWLATFRDLADRL